MPWDLSLLISSKKSESGSPPDSKESGSVGTHKAYLPLAQETTSSVYAIRVHNDDDDDDYDRKKR